MKLLNVNSSVRKTVSQSSDLAEKFILEWRKNNKQASVTMRDVGSNPPPHPTLDYTLANYTPPQERSAEMKQALLISDELIEELFEADRFVFAIPMYNFSIPSMFKAYIDNLVRVGRTFGVTDTGGFEGLLKDKKILIITTRGAVYAKDSPIAAFDHQEPYLRTVFGFMGITDITFIHADGLDFAEKQYRAESLKTAESKLVELAKTW